MSNIVKEIIPSIGSTIVQRKFIDGQEQLGEIADTQTVKGFTGAGEGWQDGREAGWQWYVE